MLQETLNEESDELRNQLEEKSELESKHEKISKYIVRKHEKKNKSGNCLFKDKFKVGMTKNIDERLKDLNTSSPYQFKIMEIYYTSFKLIKEVFSTERISVNCEWYKKIKKNAKYVNNLLIINYFLEMKNLFANLYNVINVMKLKNINIFQKTLIKKQDIEQFVKNVVVIKSF